MRLAKIVGFLVGIIIAILATVLQSIGAVNSDLSLTIFRSSSISGEVVQTLLPMTQAPGGASIAPFQFIAGFGSAGNFVGNIAPVAIFPAAPSFAGTYSLTGANAGSFLIDSATGIVRVGASDVAAGTYTMSVCATQAGLVGSPSCESVILQGVDVNDTTTFFIQLDNYAPPANSIIHVTLRNAPNTSGTDVVSIRRNYNDLGYSNELNGPWQAFIGPIGTHNVTVPLTVPNPPTDSYQFLNVLYLPNNTSGSGATWRTADMLVQPSVAATVSTALNTLLPPFTPTQTLTVCASKCQYRELSSAIIGLSDSNKSNTADNVLITMQAGTYEDCIQFGNASPFTPPTSDRIWHLPKHLWIKGVGGSFPHITGMDNDAFVCAGKGLIVVWSAADEFLTIDNLELSDWVDRAPSGAIYAASGNIALRNVYIHDGAMGIITGNSGQFVYSIVNSHFARGGGPAGPTHNIYIGENASTFTMDHSISEQALIGHEVKTRALVSHVTCNLLIGSQDPYYSDSEEVDFAQATGSGLDSHLDNNTLVKGIGSTQQNQVGWAVDFEGGYNSLLPYGISINNNIMIDDDLRGQHWFVYIGPGPYGSGKTAMTSPPNSWSNNIFVGGPLGFQDPYGSYPYNAFRLDQSGPAYPDIGQVKEIGDKQYATRTAAGITQMFPSPFGCVGTIGNLAIP